MAISFPLIPPGSPTTADIKITPNNIVGENLSPFTGSQQIFEYPGEWWEAEIALPPMTRANAEPWLAFQTALRGKSGTFLLGDPNGAPQGSAARSNVNLLAWSESLDNSTFWGRSAGLTSVTADGVVDPNGFLTAEVGTAAAGASDAYLSQALPVAIVAGQTVTFSIWLKVPSGTLNLDIFLTDNASNTLHVVTVTTSWQRFNVTRTYPGGITSAGLQIGGANTWTNSQVLHLWGGQAELASSPSAYIGTSYSTTTSTPSFIFVPTIAMNGTMQGPKFILLKGLAPNSVAFKAGDYIECGYGLNATRITTSGGSALPKYFYNPGTSVSGQIYVFSIRVRNVGTKTARLNTSIPSTQTPVIVSPGAEIAVIYVGTGDGSNAELMAIETAVIADSADIVAWSPRIQRQGFDENLIPLANQNFTGWTANGAPGITLVQGYNRRLYKVTADATSDAKGNCGVEIFPRWRAGDAVADGDPVNVFSPKGLFRLAENPRSWQVGNDLLYKGITLRCKEAI